MKEYSNHEDICRRFKDGDEESFNYVFSKLYPALVYYAFRILNDRPSAEDVASHSFIKIWRMHNTFTNYNVIKSWLYTTTRNECINILQDNKRKNSKKAMIMASFYEEMYVPDFDNMIPDANNAISYFRFLPEQCRKVFVLLFIEGKEVRQIAKILNLSISTVKNQKARGLHIIRKLMNLSHRNLPLN